MKTLSLTPPSHAVSHYDLVTLRSLDAAIPEDERDLAIQIVPAHAADASAGRISADAPVGRAVLSRKLSETITVRALGQTLSMEIVAIQKHKPDS